MEEIYVRKTRYDNIDLEIPWRNNSSVYFVVASSNNVILFLFCVNYYSHTVRYVIFKSQRNFKELVLNPAYNEMGKKNTFAGNYLFEPLLKPVCTCEYMQSEKKIEKYKNQ